MDPLVSICCITYNHETYIKDTIDGFLKQETKFPIEIIIHDDASTDRTQQIIQDYKEKYPELIVSLLQQENQYSKGNTPIFANFILPQIKGKYVAICDGDDHWTSPYKLQKQVTFLEENPEYSGCFSNFNVVDEENNLIKKDGLDSEKKATLTHEEILGEKTPKTFTSMVRYAALPKKYPRVFHNVKNGDTILFSLASRYGAFKYQNFICGNYRVHRGGTWTSMKAVEQRINQISMAKKMLAVFTEDDEQRAVISRIIRASRALVSEYFHSRQFLKAFYYLGIYLGLKTYPKLVKRLLKAN